MKSFFKLLYLLIAFSLFWTDKTSAEEKSAIKKKIPSIPSVNFHNLTKKKDGLVHNIINDIVQDIDGLIWIATIDGLVRYDGHRFIPFVELSSKGKILETGNVEDLEVDSNGNLWIITNSTISRYNYKNDIFSTILARGAVVDGTEISSFLNVLLTKEGELWIVTDKGLINEDKLNNRFVLYNSSNNKLPSDKAKELFETQNKRLFVSTVQDGLWILDKNKKRFNQFIKNFSDFPESIRNIKKITETNNGNFWAITNNGLIKINSEGNIIKWVEPEHTDWLGQEKLQDIVTDSNNSLVISTYGAGIYVLDLEGNFINHIVKNSSNSSSLVSDVIVKLFKDKDGLLWIGSENNGISIWKNNSPFVEIIEQNKNDKTKLNDGIVWSIFQDSSERLWIGTDSGLNLWDFEKQEFIEYEVGLTPSGAPAEVDAIAETNDKLLWLSTGVGLMSFDPISGQKKNYKVNKPSSLGLSATYIYKLYTDSFDRLWIGHGQGVSYLDEGTKLFIHLNDQSFPNQNISNNIVGDITEDASGNVWLGTSNGICNYLRDRTRFNCRLKEVGGTSLIDTFRINTLFVDTKTIWAGYSGNGLLKLDLDSRDDNFVEFKKGKGFPTNNVSSILKDDYGRFWISSQIGLVVFDPSNNNYTLIGSKDGLRNSEFNEGAYTKLQNGLFAFGTVEGTVIIDPKKFIFEKKKSVLSLSGIYSLSDQSRFANIDQIILPEEKSGIKIEFSNLNFFNPEQSLYQYKSGKDKEWINLGNKNEILFAESKSGTHNIYIRSQSWGGEWGPEKIVSFDVYPPLWRNNYFLVFYVLLALGSIIFFMRYRQQQLIEKYKMLDVIKENEQQLRLSLDASEQGVWDWKTKNDFMTRSKTAELLHIDAPDTLVEYWALIEENDRLEVIQSWNSHLFGKQQNYHCQYRIKLDDEDIWIEEQGRAISRDKHGMAVHISGTYRNITHLKAIEKNLNLLAKAFEDTAEGMLVVDNELNIVQVNNAVTEITGFPSDSLIGSSISARVSMDSPISFFDEVWQGVAEKGSWQGEVWQKNVDEEDIPLWLNVSEIQDKDEHDTYYVLIMSDMSERKATEEELRYLANYDTLTKLPNRALLRDRLDHALGNARRQHRPLALLFLDLDRFKNVNDSFGHAVGDGLLKIVSERLQECLREDDTVSRLGGDEFVILMEHFSSINAIAGVTEKIRIAMTHPFRLEGIDIQASFSIGVSVYPSDGEDSATLLRNADTAMYHAKSAGRNRVQFYAPKMNETALERLTLENDLRSAVGGGQLEVYYQPQVRSHDGSIYGAEALVRWNHPTRGLVMPNDFIPMAEESDLIVGLGNEVLYKACVQMQKWKEQFGIEIKISINLAARQLLQVDLARHIENVVNRAGLAPKLVCLEITETAVMEDLKRARKILETLRSKGFKIAIDDFGTGYSSLNYLRNIPLDIIKIDYSFVKELLNNSVDQAIVSAIIEIGAALDLQVLAEGIETQEQKKMLLDKGCEIFQGYFFGRPIPAEEFTKYIENSIATIEANKVKQKA